VKFHGDFDDDSTLVLTESQYFDRLDFESPLDIRLRADLLAYSSIFIGYSLSDVNLRYMLYKLNRLWERSQHQQGRPESFILLTRPNPVQEQILAKRHITPIVTEEDNPGEGLLAFLQKILKAANR